MANNLNEEVSLGDFVGIIKPILYVDEFSSKMGEDSDIITLSLFCKYYDAADDLKKFIERGYNEILSVEISDSDVEDHNYIVFIELPRRIKSFKLIENLVKDICNLTETKFTEWAMVAYKQGDARLKITLENFMKYIPYSPRAYRRYLKKVQEAKDIADLKRLLG